MPSKKNDCFASCLLLPFREIKCFFRRDKSRSKPTAETYRRVDKVDYDAKSADFRRYSAYSHSTPRKMGIAQQLSDDFSTIFSRYFSDVDEFALSDVNNSRQAFKRYVELRHSKRFFERLIATYERNRVAQRDGYEFFMDVYFRQHIELVLDAMLALEEEYPNLFHYAKQERKNRQRHLPVAPGHATDHHRHSTIVTDAALQQPRFMPLASQVVDARSISTLSLSNDSLNDEQAPHFAARSAFSAKNATLFRSNSSLGP
ncbi:hypothetical protein AAVH_12185 [Aphelenchoides avenae]|nr:hypothetical protein AAVH_12185 [Aphelenchus avenae]